MSAALEMDETLWTMALAVVPVYILTLDRFERKRWKLRAFLLILATTLCFIRMAPRMALSYYDLLSLPTNAPVYKIKKNLKEVTKHYETYFAGKPEGADYFKVLTEAQDVLLIETFRKNYARFGDAPEAVVQSGDEDAVVQAMFVSLLRHAVLGLVMMGLTMPLRQSSTRGMMVLYTIMCMAADLILRQEELDFVSSFSYNTWLPFEIVMMTRRVYPAVLMAAMTVQHLFTQRPDFALKTAALQTAALLAAARGSLPRVVELGWRFDALIGAPCPAAAHSCPAPAAPHRSAPPSAERLAAIAATMAAVGGATDTGAPIRRRRTAR
eukprot:Selendium_serpulae@DN4812_c0_g1_i1.p1